MSGGPGSKSTGCTTTAPGLSPSDSAMRAAVPKRQHERAKSDWKFAVGFRSMRQRAHDALPELLPSRGLRGDAGRAGQFGLLSGGTSRRFATQFSQSHWPDAVRMSADASWSAAARIFG